MEKLTSSIKKSINDTLGYDVFSEIGPKHILEPRGKFRNFAKVVLKPKSTGDVSLLLSILNKEKIGIVPYAGGTGLVGGQMASNDDHLLLSLEKMNKFREDITSEGILTVEAGIILSDLQQKAKDKNRVFPLALASQGSCQIGGNLATNAGGLNVIRFGNVRDLCLGLEVVMADGTIFHGLKSLYKDNTGYDIKNLMIGSEGTLGVITAATLKTFPIYDETIVSMIKIKSPENAIKLLYIFKSVLGESVQAFELISKQGLEHLELGKFKFVDPFLPRANWNILTEVSASSNLNVRNAFENILSDAIEKNIIEDAVLADNEIKMRSLWSIRENIPEANRRIGAIASTDISVPISKIPSFISATDSKLKELFPYLQINCFGHLGDGNLHYNIFPPKGKNRNEFSDIQKDVVTIIHTEAHKLGGSFSAEHGVGRLKVLDLKRYGDPGKLVLMRAIKHALDPNGILNPGAII